MVSSYLIHVNGHRMTFTRLHQSDVQDFIDLTIVGANVEHDFGRLLNARDVHRHQIFGYLSPFDCAATIRHRHVKHFRPQSAPNTDRQLIVIQLFQ